MTQKIRVGVLFGGKSAEHEVSLQSARNVIDAIDRRKYEVVLIGIDKQGRWRLSQESAFLLHADNPKLVKLNQAGGEVVLVPGPEDTRLVPLSGSEAAHRVDVVFPVLHGPFGEDGTVQGLLKLADVPFVGAGVLGSAVGMDKDVMKRLMREAGLPTPKFMVLRQSDALNTRFDEVMKRIGLPCFVKPANLGSSVGIAKAHDQEEYERALADAFQYDHKVLVEECIQGRELECSVLGNDNPIASLPGEVIPQHEFYSYEAKYIDENGAILEIPAKLPERVVAKVQDLAVSAFKVLCCEGMARADFFLRNDEEVILNEINTIPGFTKISMYPKLWEVSGISYTELIDRLIQLALERHEREHQLKTSYNP